MANEEDWYLSTLRTVMEQVATEVEPHGGKISDEAEAEVLEYGVDAFLNELARQHDTAIQEERESRAQMEGSIENSWGHALDLLDSFILVNQKAERHFELLVDIEEKGENYQFDALIRLHARALKVSREIVALLRAGFASGAMARWRTLHEIAAVSNIIAENGEEAGERFLKFKTAKDLFQVQTNFREHFDALGFDEIDEKAVCELEEQTEDLTEEFGEAFDAYNGWAVEFVDFDGGKLTVSDLIEAGGLEHYLPFYALACDAIHAGSKGTLFQIGLHEMDISGEEEVLLTGRSDLGFTDPAQLTAIMLRETMETLRVLVGDLNWQAYWEIYFQAMDILVDEIADAFWLVDQMLSIGRKTAERSPTNR
jgi:hypothetical protein